MKKSNKKTINLLDANYEKVILSLKGHTDAGTNSIFCVTIESGKSLTDTAKALKDAASWLMSANSSNAGLTDVSIEFSGR